NTDTVLPSSRFWENVWTSGVTEPGSSGSPLLIVSKQQVIGQLYGGGSSCTAQSSPDFYGRFDVTFPLVQSYLAAVSVTVPNVAGKTESAAQSAITSAGLAEGTVTQQSSTTVTAGVVISQNPLAGTRVAQGTIINLVVSTGPPRVTVPNLVKQTQSAAQTAITHAGLTLGTVTPQASTTVPAGQVISQTPAAGTQVASGSVVDLVVSTSPLPVTVPNLVGQTQSAAQTALTNADLTLGVVSQQASAAVPAGQIVSQTPAAGTQVVSGSAVDLIVSAGPPKVSVPSVTGTTQSAAQTAITNAGLATGGVSLEYSAAVPSGDVISQNPAAGTSVAPSSPVDLTISEGPQPPTGCFGGTINGISFGSPTGKSGDTVLFLSVSVVLFHLGSRRQRRPSLR
ncbi:MAG: PASTA domain-containing protein, partial [Candidatus Hydrogenedentes bacterium]|nr:PASTA domain-containing protein [Candidatus Hydrogenedentota bacterium]